MSDNKKPPQVPEQLKTGSLLKYKKRIFKSNWRESAVRLYSNATIVSKGSGKNESRETRIQMTNQTTLIIFGRQLKDVPKKPILPSGYRMDQLLAIGLIVSSAEKALDGSERMTIIFHWFLSPSMKEMFEWIIAINNSIPDNKQIITNDELTMSLVMAEAVHFNHLMMLEDNHNHSRTTSNGGGHTIDDGNTGENGRAWINGTQGDEVRPIMTANGHQLSNLTASDYYYYDYYYSDLDLDTGAGAGDIGGGGGGFDCGGDFDDCSAFAAADAFAVF